MWYLNEDLSGHVTSDVKALRRQGMLLQGDKKRIPWPYAPEITTVQRNFIKNPMIGLEIFNTESNKGECFNGREWIEV